PDRHHGAGGIAHVNAIDILDPVAETRVGLDVHLPGAAEQIEVVDVEAAERRLQRVENVYDLDPQHLRLVAIDVEIDLRRVGGEGAEDCGELGLLIRRHEEGALYGRDLGGRLSLQRLERILESAGVAETEDGWQVEGEDDGAGDCAQLRPEARE